MIEDQPESEIIFKVDKIKRYRTPQRKLAINKSHRLNFLEGPCYRGKFQEQKRIYRPSYISR